jgi:hypothetical protein
MVSAGDDTVHKVLLVLHRTELKRVRQIDDRRHASTSGAEQLSLRRGWAIHDVIWRAQKSANQLALRFEKGALDVRCQKSILNVHTWVQHLNHQGRELPWRVVILLQAVHQALPRSKVHNSLSGHRKRDGPTLGRVLALGFNGHLRATEHIELSFGISLLKDLAHFSGRRNRVKHTGVRQADLGILSDKVITGGGDSLSSQNVVFDPWYPS